MGLLLMAGTAWAQEVGTVAAVEGTAEIGRAGAWTPASIGTALQKGDELRTGRPGRLQIVFQDDSTLAVSEDSRVVIDEQVFNPEQGTSKSLMGLLQGKVNALVSEYYHRTGASYEIKTATAVAGVRGTEFSMTYDPREDVTEVVGVSGRITVHSLVDPTGPGVLLTANETTTVVHGQLPSPPHRLGEAMFRQQLQGIEFIGGGRAESLSAAHPVVAGTTVPAPDRAPAVNSGGIAPDLGQRRDASNLVGKSPVVIGAMTGSLGIVIGRPQP